MILLVIYCWNGKQGCNGAALDNIKNIIHQAPLYVLWGTEMRFYLSANLFQLYNLFVGQCLFVLFYRFNCLFLCATSLRCVNSQLFSGDLFIDNLTVTYFIVIGIYQSGNQGLAQAKAGIDGYYLSVTI